ncbi:MAG: (2Fe-2S)-binding protein [Alphaproteobacteria bacterium]
MNAPASVVLRVNGRTHAVAAPAPTTLLTVLRDDLGLTGAKRGCNQGVCGACTVLVDGDPVRACLSVAANCEGQDITTVEAVAAAGVLAPVQQALVDTGAVQCGFCTSGVIMTAYALLRDNRRPDVDTVRAALSGNLCRCSGYTKIVDAVLRAGGAAAS